MPDPKPGNVIAGDDYGTEVKHMSKPQTVRTKSTGKRGGRGSHGSLTKAGKVRDITWRDHGLHSGNLEEYYARKKAENKSPSPRIANRRRFHRRFNEDGTPRRPARRRR